MKSIIQGVRWALCLVVSLASTAVASDSKSTQAEIRPKSTWTVDDVLSEEGAFSFKISPDCRWVVWEKSDNLFLSSLTEKKEIQRTQQGEGCDNPKWSPDGHLIAFISSRPNPKLKVGVKASAQIWLIKPFEGEPWPVTAGEQAVSGFDWSGTNSIIFSMKDPPSPDKQTNIDDSLVVGDESLDPPIRLFQVDVDSGKVTALTDNRDPIRGFWVSPNGRYVVTIHVWSSYMYDQSRKPLIFVTDLTTGQRKPFFTDAKYGIRSVSWERDSSGFYATGSLRTHSRYSYPAITVLYHYTLATGAIERVGLGWEKGISWDWYRTSSESVIGVTDQGFITLLADGARPKLVHFSRVGNSWQREFVTGIHSVNVFDFELGQDGKTFVYQYSDSSHPGQWYGARLEGTKIDSPMQLTSLNPQFQSKPTAESEIVHWKGALGETVEGMLYYPIGYQLGKKYPLVVEIHGGPEDLIMDKWYGFILNNNLLNERGVFVFRPNYHGSSNYGLKWAESTIGRLNKLEVEDIETGVDYLIHRGLIDPDKLAVTGWSQGGALTASVTVSTGRYKAAISGAGVVDWIDYWARSDFGGWFCGSYFGKTPMDDPRLYVTDSSFYKLNKVTTPTLILFGMEDNRTPVEQGWMYYRALQQTGKADVRFVLFPGDGHAPLHHAKRAMEEELAWLDKYLLKRQGE